MKRTILLMIMASLMISCSSGDGPGSDKNDTPPLHSRSYDVHLFYYTWYGIPPVEGEFHGWTGSTPAGESSERFEGGADIASSFFPAYGTYSSSDADIINSHIDQIAAAKIGVICVSWWMGDSLTAAPVGTILDSAARSNLKVCFRIETRDGDSAEAVMDQASYILERWRDHDAFYITDRFGNRPLFYIGSSWSIDADDWARYLSASGDRTIRGTESDALFIGVWKDREDGERLERAGFDGFHTWFASSGGSWGSDEKNFQEMNLFSMDSGLMFIPTVSPGFDDRRINPTNARAARIRGGGSQYMECVQKALKVQPPFLTINSFNNWLDGTQIEPATPMRSRTFTYKDYGAQNEYLYLRLSAQWIQGFSK